jgi:two-component system phosphate regulon sensor histidine kinase PhoR
MTERAFLFQRRFAPLLKAARIVTFDWDLAGGTLRLSRNAAGVLGLAGVRQPSFALASHAHPADRAAHRARVERALLKGGRFSSKFRYIRPTDNRVLTLESHGLVVSRRGKAVLVRGFVLDVTKRATVERALRREQRELQLVLDAVPALVWYKDLENRVLRCNEAVARALGLRTSEVEGRDVEQLYPGRGAKFHADDREVIASGRPKLGILETIDTTAGRRWLETDKFPQRDESGRIIGLIVFSKDVTERRRAEEVLRRSERLQREFVAHVSHEFRTPVSAIKGFAETLRKGGLGDRKNRGAFVRIIERHADRLSWLIEDLLALSALDAGEAKLKLEPVALAGFLADYVKSVGSLTRAGDIRVALKIPPGLIARADRPRLLQIVENLMGNAIKYGRRGGWIKVSARAAGRWIEVEVADDGRGIPRAKLPRIFEPFFKAENMNAGTGLGLHIVKKIVEAHGGKVWAVSAVGRGSSFFFTVRAQPGA